jgi:hypothetical protein
MELFDAVVQTARKPKEIQEILDNVTLEEAKEFVRKVASEKSILFWEIFKHDDDLSWLSGTGERLP